MIVLFGQKGGSYGDYPIWSQIAAGWVVSGLVFISGFIAKAVVNHKKKTEGFVEDEINWDSVPVQASSNQAKAKTDASANASKKTSSPSGRKTGKKKKK